MIKRQLLIGFAMLALFVVVVITAITTQVAQDASAFGRASWLKEELQWRVANQREIWKNNPTAAAQQILERVHLVCHKPVKSPWHCWGRSTEMEGQAQAILRGSQRKLSENDTLKLDGQEFRIASQDSETIGTILIGDSYDPTSNSNAYSATVAIAVAAGIIFWIAGWTALVMASWFSRRLSAKDEILAQKNAFLAFVSHELRTPLIAIVGLSENLSEGLYGELSNKQAQMVETISKSGEHLTRLINDLLTISELRGGQLETKNHWVKLQFFVEEIAELFGYLANKEGVHLELSIPKTEQWVFIDEVRLRQILVNLITNALKFTKRGGKVGLVLDETGGENILFEIWDTGIGIPKEQLETVFESFAKVSNENVTKQAGTGLGLPITRKLVTLLGGDIRVESKVSEGTRFFVELPMSPAGVAVPPRPQTQQLLRSVQTPIKAEIEAENIPSVIPHSTPAHPCGIFRILLVDDTPTNLIHLRDYLQHLGHIVEEASNGTTAVEKTSHMTFDLIFMDVQMPGMDGFEATSRIRNLDLETHPRIAILSAHVSQDVRQRAQEARADDVLQKPLKLGAIKEYLDQIKQPSKQAQA
jgi:signal transduction histidine kinase/ActR/RegA family two-component response regulator